MVKIPATSANLGPGFDCLGLAMTLYNRVTFTAVSEPTWTITVSGVDAHKVATDDTNLVYQSAEQLFVRLGQRPSGLHIHQENAIPVGSGLGSSSTAVLAGLLAANEWCGRPLSLAQLLQLAAEQEGHPDNVAPALYGGLTLSIAHQTGLHIEPYTLPNLQMLVLLPTFELPTREARAVLPTHVSRQDAIFNAARLPLLIQALQSADYDRLALAMQDKLHQPYRLPLIPGMEQAFAAAKAAGARAVALSGAGPSLIAFAPDGHDAIRQAATAVFAEAGLACRSWLLAVDKAGSQVQTMVA